METLFSCLEALAGQPLGTVVHVGAGHPRILERYAAFSVGALVLVEGDPELGAELSDAAAGRVGVTVKAAAVGSHDGVVDWHRYNLPALNGPLDAEPLRSYYPRVRELSV